MASLALAYLLLFFGGGFGLHHFYLGRDNQGILSVAIAPWWIVTLPVWAMSWIRDFFRLPSYVASVNRDPVHLAPRKEAVKQGAAPTFSMSRFLAEVFFATYFSMVGSNLKIQQLFGVELAELDVALGLIGVTIGATMVASCGDEKADWWYILGGAVAGEVIQRMEGPVSPVFCAAIAATWFRAYRPDLTYIGNAKGKSTVGGMFSNGCKVGFMMSLILFATITSVTVEVNGEDISIREAITNALRSEGFSDFVSIFNDFYANWQAKGFEEAFKEFAETLKERFDVDGEDHAYKVLGLKPGATMSEMKKAHRKLALQNHPDKGGDDDKFREIQEAYEKLKKIMKAKAGGARSSDPVE